MAATAVDQIGAVSTALTVTAPAGIAPQVPSADRGPLSPVTQDHTRKLMSLRRGGTTFMRTHLSFEQRSVASLPADLNLDQMLLTQGGPMSERSLWGDSMIYLLAHRYKE